MSVILNFDAFAALDNIQFLFHYDLRRILQLINAIYIISKNCSKILLEQLFFVFMTFLFVPSATVFKTRFDLHLNDLELFMILSVLHA